jgi:general secretion pathway protein F
MPVFEYKGLSGGGKAVSGMVDADSARSARAKLRKDGVFPTEIKEQRGSSEPEPAPRARRKGNGKAGAAGVAEEEPAKKVSLNMEVDFGRYFQRIKVSDVAITTRQMATLVGAGIPLVEGLAAVADQTDNDKFRVVLTEIKGKVNEGSSLAEAIKGYPKVFSELYRNMVAAGEQSGTLDVVLSKLADYTEGQVALRSKIIGALVYPAIMAVVGLGLVSFLMIAVVPKIAKIFDDMGATLPLITRILIGVSSFVASWWFLLIPLAIGAFFLLRRWARTENGTLLLDTWSLKLPIFGKLFLLVAVARFASTLSTLLSSGVPILTSMSIVRAVVDNVVIQDVLDQVRESVSEGQSIAIPLRKSEQFPPLVTHMITIGERTGELEQMLARVAESYEAQVDRTVGMLTTLLEPVMILVMGGGVGFIALSVLLPMLNISQIVR